MATLFDIVQMELDHMSSEDLTEPGREIESDENLVSEADLELRKLFTLWRNWDRAAAETEFQARYVEDEEKKREILLAAFALSRKAELIRDFFWASVRDTLGLWDKDVVSIRQGWKITWSEREESAVPDLLHPLEVAAVLSSLLQEPGRPAKRRRLRFWRR